MTTAISGVEKRRLVIIDQKSGIRFLVDTGADVSVLPASFRDRLKLQDLTLQAFLGILLFATSTEPFWERIFLLTSIFLWILGTEDWLMAVHGFLLLVD